MALNVKLRCMDFPLGSWGRHASTEEKHPNGTPASPNWDPGQFTEMKFATSLTSGNILITSGCEAESTLA